MSTAILALNAGSSSLKVALCCGQTGATLLTAKITGIGRAPRFSAKGKDGAPLPPGPLTTLATDTTHEDTLGLLMGWIDTQLGHRTLAAVGHRVVHGGAHHTKPTLITPPVLAELRALIPLAPLHQPHNLAAIDTLAKHHPDLPQVACFDTSFHRSQPRLQQIFALPRALTERGILRYGFHGLSYDYIASALPAHLGARADGRVIVAHLGNGASLCAMKNRQSVATTMGFTALDGLVMGRRCGTLDPGVLLYLMQHDGMDAAQIETLLYRQSGLLGVSDLSNNMRDLQAANTPEAQEAIGLFATRAASQIASLLPAIGGLDALVFTAGIGENSAPIRALICDQLHWLGVTLDAQANAANSPRIHAADSPIDVLVLPTDEESVIIAATRALTAAKLD